MLLSTAGKLHSQSPAPLNQLLQGQLFRLCNTHGSSSGCPSQQPSLALRQHAFIYRGELCRYIHIRTSQPGDTCSIQPLLVPQKHFKMGPSVLPVDSCSEVLKTAWEPRGRQVRLTGIRPYGSLYFPSVTSPWPS